MDAKNMKQTQSQAQKTEFKREFSLRLRNAMDHNGYKKHGGGAQLADEMNVRHQSVRRWLNGEATPTKEKQEQLAATLNVSLQWLMFGNGSMLANDEVVRTGVAIIEHSEIESWLSNPDDVEPYRQSIPLPNPNGYLFALRQQGDAMATTRSDSIPDQAVTVIDSRDKRIHPGERYIIKLNKYQTPICRLAKASDTGKILFVSTNPANLSTEQFNPETDKVYGKVKHIML